MTKILQGMRVVEGSAFVAVPLAGMTLVCLSGLAATWRVVTNAPANILRGS